MSGGSWGPQGLASITVVLAAVGFGLMPVFVRQLTLLEVPAEVIAFYRFAVAAVALLPFLSLRPRNIRATGAGMVAGAAVGFGFVAFVVTLERTTMVAANVLYLTYPVFTLVLAWVLINLLPRTLTAVSALLLGCAAWLLYQGPPVGHMGFTALAIALGAPLSLAYALTVQRGWMQQLGPLQRMSSVALGAALVLTPLALRHGVQDVVPQGAELAYVLGLGLASTALPHVVLTIAAPRMGPPKTAVALGFEIPLVVLFSWVIYGERSGLFAVGAAGLTLAALIVVGFSRHLTGRPPMA